MVRDQNGTNLERQGSEKVAFSVKIKKALAM